MTIGIAVSGPKAGLAAYRALRAVESVGRGAIGGFASFVALDEEGRLLTAETQRGGAQALWDGGDPPFEIAEARLAVMMSSGPDRPEPLIQFTPADPKVGLITGHRLPNMPVRTGEGDATIAPNLAALERMRAGAGPETAIAEALGLDPECDAGLIAMDLSGRIALGDSAAVARRDDRGRALVEDPTTGLRIGVLHNSIFPHRALAMLAVSAALDAATPGDYADDEASLIGVPCRMGEERCLHLDEAGRPLEITVVDPVWLGAYEGSAVRRGDPVRADGHLVGRVTWEVYCVVGEGRIVSGRGGGRIAWSAAAEGTPG